MTEAYGQDTRLTSNVKQPNSKSAHMHHRCVRQREQLLDHLFGSVPWLHRSPTHDLPGARVST